MEDRIRIFLNNYINGLYFPTVHLTDVIEILIITVIVYEIMLWIKNTKAWMLLKGMIMLGAFFLLAAIFKMHTILFGKGVDQRTCNSGSCRVPAGT